MKNFKQSCANFLALVFSVAFVFATLAINTANAGQASVTRFDKAVSRKCDQITYTIDIEVTSNGMTSDNFTLIDAPVPQLIKLASSANVVTSASSGVMPTVTVSTGGYLKVKFSTPVTGGKTTSTVKLTFSQKIDPAAIGNADLTISNQAVLQNDALSEGQLSKDPSKAGSPATPKGLFVKAEYPTSINVPIAGLKQCLQVGPDVADLGSTCLKGDTKVTCGAKPGTFVITLSPSGPGGVVPATVQVTSLTPGVTIVSPASSYPVVAGHAYITLAGANPGDVVDLQVEGSSSTPNPETGLSTCCNGKVSITIPKDLDCKEKTPNDVAIKKTGATTPEPSVGAYTFALALTNEGAAFTPASGVLTVTDVVPTGMTFNSITGSAGWTCLPATAAAAGTPITCTFAGGALAAGPAAPIGTINIVATASGAAPFPPFTNCADIGTAANAAVNDTKLPNNHSCVTVTKPPVGDMSSVKVLKTCEAVTHVDTPTLVGFEAKCKIKVTSTGPGSTPLVVTETLTATGGTITAATPVPATDPWACAPFGAGPMTCTLPANIMTGPTDASEIDVTVQFPATGNTANVKNCAKLTAGMAQVPESCVDIPTVSSTPVDLSIEKTFTKGATDTTGSFSLAVKNEGGQITAPTQIKVSDPIPIGLTINGLGAEVGANWNCGGLPINGPATINCSYIGPMPVPAGTLMAPLNLNATLSTVSATSTEPKIFQNCATVGATNAGAPITETSSTNNQSCTVTKIINVDGDCTKHPDLCPKPKAQCDQDVLFVVDNSVSITDTASVGASITNFINPMIGKGGKINIFNFNNKTNWLPRTSGWIAAGSVTAGMTGITVGGTRTNWDDALERAYNEVNAHSPKPLVIFITDGEPTAYNNATGGEVDAQLPTAQPVLASTEAVTWINQIRAAGSPVIAVGFGPVVSQGYLDAAFTGSSVTSPPGSLDFGTSSVIKTDQASGLRSIMKTLSGQMCGTLQLTKQLLQGGDGFKSLPAGTTSYNASYPVKYRLSITNNSATAINNIVVKDDIPVVLTAPGATPAPVNGTAIFTGNNLVWTLPTLGAHSSTTMDISSTFTKTYNGPWPKSETVNNYAQVTGADNYSATLLDNMNHVTGAPTEQDESSAQFSSVYYEQTPPQTCTDAVPPSWCYGTINKYRSGTINEGGTCTSSPAGGPVQTCSYQLSFAPGTLVPPGSTITLTDTLTMGGSPVSWPMTMTGALCTTLPAVDSFTCIKGAANSASINLSIPAGQIGQLQNCLSATITNTSPAINKTFGPICASLTLNGSSAKIAQLPPTLSVSKTCDPVILPAGVTTAKAHCSIAVTTTGGPLPRTINLVEDLHSQGAQITALSSMENWSFPALPSAAGQPLLLTISGADIAAAGGSSTIDVDLGLTDISIPSTSYNCVSAAGFDDAGLATLDAAQVCAPIQVISEAVDEAVTPVVTPPEPIQCDPATATQAGDLCRCRFDNMQQTSKTSCECKDGFDLTKGKGCFKPEPKCDGVTAKARGSACACIYRNMSQVSETSCGCGKGTKFVKGKGCLPIEPVCPNGTKFNAAHKRCEAVCDRGQVYNAKRNRCDTLPPVCKRNQHNDPRTGKCVSNEPVCRAPYKYNAKTNQCVQVLQPRGGGCPFPLVPNPLNGRCINPGVIIDLFNDGSGDPGRPKDNGQVNPGPKVCRDGDTVVPCR